MTTASLTKEKLVQVPTPFIHESTSATVRMCAYAVARELNGRVPSVPDALGELSDILPFGRDKRLQYIPTNTEVIVGNDLDGKPALLVAHGGGVITPEGYSKMPPHASCMIPSRVPVAQTSIDALLTEAKKRSALFSPANYASASEIPAKHVILLPLETVVKPSDVYDRVVSRCVSLLGSKLTEKDSDFREYARDTDGFAELVNHPLFIAVCGGKKAATTFANYMRSWSTHHHRKGEAGWSLPTLGFEAEVGGMTPENPAAFNLAVGHTGWNSAGIKLVGIPNSQVNMRPWSVLVPAENAGKVADSANEFYKKRFPQGTTPLSMPSMQDLYLASHADAPLVSS